MILGPDSGLVALRVFGDRWHFELGDHRDWWDYTFRHWECVARLWGKLRDWCNFHPWFRGLSQGQGLFPCPRSQVWSEVACFFLAIFILHPKVLTDENGWGAITSKEWHK